MSAATWIVRGAFVLMGLGIPAFVAAQSPPARDQTIAAMRRAADYFHGTLAVRGGYVYYYSPDGRQRLGEGPATASQVWVQVPGTPAVGMAYLAAWQATGDPFYRQAARDAAGALVYGQLASGGWTNLVDFDPGSKQAGRYRNGRGRGRNYSSLDDGITQQALRLVMHVDRAFDFNDAEIHAAAKVALDALLAAQFANGGFPQVWDAPPPPRPIVPARYPDYDWRTENRIKEYWYHYTLNDNVAGNVAATLLDAWEIYGDPRYREALARLGDFLILAQMPAPQPGWAQQYDDQMRPAWARKFEPPALSGRESQDAIATLLEVYRVTGDEKYLEPIPRALAWLETSLLPDGQLARYYELQTNRPLYMTRDYRLTHDDRDLPAHYGWKTESQLDDLKRQYTACTSGHPEENPSENRVELARRAADVLAQLDDQGRWMSHYAGGMLVGQPKFRLGEAYLASEVFSDHLQLLSRYIEATAR